MIYILNILIVYIFIVYDAYVQLRSKKVAGIAGQSNKIVSSSFLRSVKDRLLKARNEEEMGNTGHSYISLLNFGPKKLTLRDFL